MWDFHTQAGKHRPASSPFIILEAAKLPQPSPPLSLTFGLASHTGWVLEFYFGPSFVPGVVGAGLHVLNSGFLGDFIHGGFLSSAAGEGAAGPCGLGPLSLAVPWTPGARLACPLKCAFPKAGRLVLGLVSFRGGGL